MYVKVRVQPSAKEEEIVRESSDHLRVSVKEPAQRNLANKRVQELLALEFAVPLASVRLVSGHHSPGKIFSLPDL